MMNGKVFVIGSSGSVGRATVQALSSKYASKCEIYAGTRDIEKAEYLKLLPSVAVVQAKMGDKIKLKDSFRGIDALFIVTPGTEDRALLTLQTAEAAKEAGVKFILAVSVPTVEHKNTILGNMYHKIETELPRLGIPYSFLRLPEFLDSNLSNKNSIKNESTIYSSVDPNRASSSVALEDVGRVAAIILTNYTQHINTTYTLISDHFTNNDLVKAFTVALGREIKYVRLSHDDTKQMYQQLGLPQWQCNGLMEMLKLIDDGIIKSGSPDLSIYRTLTGEEPTSLNAWIAKHIHEF